MEVCEEMMRGMPKHEWRHKGGGGSRLAFFLFLRILVSVRWAHVRPVDFRPSTRPSISNGKIYLFSISTRTRTFFLPQTLFHRGLSVRA